MKYVALIYTPEDVFENLSPEQAQTLAKEYDDCARQAQQAGVLTGGARLAPSTAATSVRMRNGERLVADGPFAETKEVLGGFLEFECNNLDEALAWAARIPGARHGTIEVRPVIPT